MAQTIQINGQFYPQQSSDSETCRLEFNNGICKFYTGSSDLKEIVDINALIIEPRIGRLARKIKLPDGSVFKTDDNDAVDELTPNDFWKQLFKLEKVGWHLVPMAIATPFLAYGLYRLVIPIFIGLGITLTPDSALYVIDKNSMRSIDFTLTDPSAIDADRQAEITAMFDDLLKQRQTHDLTRTNRRFKYNLQFRKSNALGPNAFALPGGTVMVTDDLVKEYGDDHVLRAILAHEIGHVECQHSLSRLYRALGMAAMVTLIAGDAGPLLEDMLLEGSALLSLSFSRAHEMESDNYSYELLSKAGYRTDGLIDFFEKLEENHPLPKDGEWMMTHPLSQKRIENIKNKIEAEN